MNGPKKSMVAALLFVTVLCPRVSAAIEIQMFDDMAIEDQRDCLKFLVKRAEKLFVDEGRQDLAAKVDQLFKKIHRGDRQSPGEAAFEKSLNQTRAAIAEGTLRFLTIQPGVESVLMTTFFKSGIQPSTKFWKNLTLLAREKPFWPKLPLRVATALP